MSDEIIRFLAVSAVVIITPGPDTVLTIRNTLLGGRRGGVFTALGVVGGQATWALATLLAASEPVFGAVRMGGAAYLIYLGGASLVGAVRRDGQTPRAPRDGIGERSLAPLAALRQGLISNLTTSPAMALFFVSLLPQFARRGGFALADAIGMGLGFCAMSLLWLLGYSIAVAKAGEYLLTARVRRVVEAVASAVLIALGLSLAAESCDSTEHACVARTASARRSIAIPTHCSSHNTINSLRSQRKETSWIPRPTPK